MARLSPRDRPPLTLRGGRVGLEEVARDGPRRELALVRLADGRVSGRAVIGEEADALVIEALCVDPAARGYGLGSEAAALLRAFAREAGWSRLRASAAPDLGLSAYFWIRMGLRPLHGEGPGGGIWFERAL